MCNCLLAGSCPQSKTAGNCTSRNLVPQSCFFLWCNAPIREADMESLVFLRKIKGRELGVLGDQRDNCLQDRDRHPGLVTTDTGIFSLHYLFVEITTSFQLPLFISSSLPFSFRKGCRTTAFKKKIKIEWFFYCLFKPIPHKHTIWKWHWLPLSRNDLPVPDLIKPCERITM